MHPASSVQPHASAAETRLKLRSASLPTRSSELSSTSEPLHTVSLVLDNHPAHHSKRVRAYCERVGLSLKFLPPYSSPLNPVERIWNQVKHWWGKRMSRLRVPFDHDNIAWEVKQLLDEVAARQTEDLLRCIDPYIRRVGCGQLI